MNFLYLPNQRDWNFKTSTVETLRFYFKNLDRNYILFEIFKNGYFCILIKRNDNGKLDYYRINSDYNEVKDNFFAKNEESQTVLLDFETIESNLIGSMKKLSDKEYKEVLYGNRRSDKTVLWLNENKQTVFGKIYKYLLNTSLIQNDNVKESLLITSGKDKIYREFTSGDSDKIFKMQNQQKQIERLKSIKDDFNSFKKLVEKCNTATIMLKKYLNSFKTKYQDEFRETTTSINNTSQMIDEMNQKVIPPLTKKKDELTKQIGATETEIKRIKKDITKEEEKYKRISSYESASLLKAALGNLKKEYNEKQYQITQIKREKLTLEGVRIEIRNIKAKIEKLTREIENFSNLLIHHISKSDNTKQVLNTILSGEILKLDKNDVIRKIGDIPQGKLEIFDGLIDISKIKQKEYITIDSLTVELHKAQEALEKLEKIQESIETYSEIENSIKSIDKEIKNIEKMLEEIEQLPQIQKAIEELQDEEKKLQDKLNDITNQSKENSEAINEVEEQLKQLLDKQKKEAERKSELQAFYMLLKDDLEECCDDSIQSDTILIDSIEELVQTIQQQKKSIEQDLNKKREQFSDLKHFLKKEHAIEEEFIQEVEEEIDTIKDKEHTVDKLIQSITDEISSPTASFLKELEYFEKYVISLNTAFKKYKISNIKNIEIKLRKNKTLVENLKIIANINRENLFNIGDDDNRSYEEQINILKKYISESARFTLFDLFDISFLINGEEVKLKEQIESTGTDRILKIMLFILILKDSVIKDEKNRLVIYFDELGEVDDKNSLELIKICKENNFLPIFASPDKKTHIDKYYDLQILPNGKTIVDEKRSIRVKDRV